MTISAQIHEPFCCRSVNKGETKKGTFWSIEDSRRWNVRFGSLSTASMEQFRVWLHDAHVANAK
jgi:hypothetical protein